MKFRIFLIISIILIAILLIWMGIYLPENPFGQEKIFLVERGQSFFEISRNLANKGLIKDDSYFNLYLLLTGNYKRLKSGQYLFSSSMTISEIAKKIVSGDVMKEKITIIEGWNLRDIGWYLENRGLFQAEELFEIVGFPLIDYSKVTDLPQPKDFSQEFDFLKDKPKNLGLEGYLFPDTYYIREQEIEEIVRKMLENFDKKFTLDLKEEINRQSKTIFEIVTMASLLEKEVKTIEDKKLVSGILWKRLKNNIPLQVDATISYLTGKKTTKISKEETHIDSPYNTYKYKGLPLGPICSPGLESILASLYPKNSEYWYYLSTPTGETIFNKTLEEHNLAKAEYLK
ncbi:endolytic transglycosylase MltG [Patescibacteria group bacterium]|nr:endolytic transglycosylase MltG [Patescibacteria group bacterium]